MALTQYIDGTVKGIQSATVTLNDSQIKALNSSYAVIVPEQGVGKVINFIGGYINLRAVVSYDNISSDAVMILQYGNFENDCSCLVPFNGASFFSNITPLTKETTNPNYPTSNLNLRITSGNIENEALKLVLDNFPNGPITGGNAANSLEITVFYTISNI